MEKKININILGQELKGKIRNFYPYLLGFYLLSLLVSVFSKTWQAFFYWPGFHGVLIFFTLLFVLTFKINLKFRTNLKFRRINFKRLFKFKGFSFKSGIKIKELYFERRIQFIGFAKNSARQADRQVRKYFILVYRRLLNINRKTWLKIIIIAAILIFSLIKNIGVLDFLVLFYALISFLFILDSRIAAGVALVLLVSCPFFLIFKEDSLAENAAIYAYYFLIITVLTQIREMKKEEKEAKL